MIKIGVVNIDISHPKSFAQYLAKGNRARYAAIYNDGFRQDDEVGAFIEKFKLDKRFDSIDELAGYVDIGFVQSCNWDKHLGYAMPFIKKGKPVFIDKPIAGSISDLKKLEKLEEEGAVILGSSSLRYCDEIREFKNKPADERGEIMNVYITGGLDEFNYGIHIAEALGGITGTGAKTVRFSGRSVKDNKICETYFVQYENGITATYNTFQGMWQPFDVVIMTNKGTFSFRIDTTKLYGPMLDKICDYMETGKKSIAGIKEITESVKIMLAGKISRESKGKEININNIPEDDPGYDGNLFEEGYAKAARKIYL